jgi:hypothetical protein
MAKKPKRLPRDANARAFAIGEIATSGALPTRNYALNKADRSGEQIGYRRLTYRPEATASTIHASTMISARIKNLRSARSVLMPSF